ncbi:MAG: hypothetical protein EAZ25_27130 [Oscillatoriales cyanobacterium]|nr:MAG: hypothetical protein EAZ25_27130 [Oscillatoriales cyanobacterium]
MKKAETDMEDELRSEYDLKSLRVRKVGHARKSFSGLTVHLEPDVAEMFPRVMKDNKYPLGNMRGND